MGKENYRNHKFEDNTLWIQVTLQDIFSQNMMLKGTYMDMLDIAEKYVRNLCSMVRMMSMCHSIQN